MKFTELLAIAIGLSMDAFAVSIGKGLSIKKINIKKILIISSYFCFFHLSMIILGYFLGSTFTTFIQKIDHWLAFILLLIIGLEMIKDSFKNEQEKVNDKLDFKSMFLLGIATSIDALAIGVTFAFFDLSLILVLSTIGVTILILSSIGTIIGNKFGNKLSNKAKILGGIILIFMGLKILFEHIGIIELIFK